MKNKDKIKWAREIAHYQDIITANNDKQEVHEAEMKILELVDRIERIDPMAIFEVDEIVPTFLTKTKT